MLYLIIRDMRCSRLNKGSATRLRNHRFFLFVSLSTVVKQELRVTLLYNKGGTLFYKELHKKENVIRIYP